jgi:outer membrane beta-barrel protein
MRLTLFLRRVFISHLLGLLFAGLVFADDVIELPIEELAKESVLPVFDRTVVVRNRAVTTEGRFEIGGGLGLSLIEALYKNTVFGVNAAYHFDEINGIHLQAVFQSQGLSNNGNRLKQGLFGGGNFDPSLAPSPEYFAFANYQFTAYYGKISLSKQRALNLSLFGLAGLGVVSFGDSTQPALNFGFGQKFYFTPNIAFRYDLTGSVFQGPDPTQPNQGNLSSGPKLGSSDFEQTLYFRSLLTAGIVFLL